MKFSGKMIFMIILKATKEQGFTLSLEDKYFEKPQGWGQIDRFRVKGNAARTEHTRYFFSNDRNYRLQCNDRWTKLF